jgi:uncharacterized membrane protein YagU involved in acid resistance
MVAVLANPEYAPVNPTVTVPLLAADGPVCLMVKVSSPVPVPPRTAHDPVAPPDIVASQVALWLLVVIVIVSLVVPELSLSKFTDVGDAEMVN